MRLAIGNRDFRVEKGHLLGVNEPFFGKNGLILAKKQAKKRIYVYSLVTMTKM
jgi:hypothetical protein